MQTTQSSTSNKRVLFNSTHRGRHLLLDCTPEKALKTSLVAGSGRMENQPGRAAKPPRIFRWSRCADGQWRIQNTFRPSWKIISHRLCKQLEKTSAAPIRPTTVRCRAK